MKHYRELTKSNAPVFLQDYIKQKDVGLEYLEKYLLSYGFDMASFDYSPESLIPIWDLLHSKIEFSHNYPDYEVHLDELPIWILLDLGFHGEDFGGYSIEAIKIIDGLAYYIAEVFLKNNESAHWDVCPWADPKITGVNQPVIRLRPKSIWLGAFLNPLSICKVSSVYTHLYKENFSIKDLYNKYNFNIENFVNNPPPAPPISEFKDSYPILENKLQEFGIYELEELVEIEILAKGERVTIDEIECNKAFHTTPALENILGENSFRNLEESLMSVEGIKFAAQEDRDVFYLKSSVAKKKLQIAIIDKLESLVG